MTDTDDDRAHCTAMDYLDAGAAHDEVSARTGTLRSLPRLDFIDTAMLDADTLRILRDHLLSVYEVMHKSTRDGHAITRAIIWLKEIESNLSGARATAEISRQPERHES